MSHLHSWENNGRLRVSANGHYLEHADGTGFFWLGCTAWRLPSLKPEDIERYLKDRAGKGFNLIQFTMTNMASPDYAGRMPFKGPGPQWKSVKLNEDYWKHVDFIIERARHYGLWTALFVLWGPHAGDEGPGKSAFFSDPPTHNNQFGGLLGKRYGDEPNIIWVVSGEYHKPGSAMFPRRQAPLSPTHRGQLTRLAQGIREGDSGRNLMTIHPISFLSSSDDFHNEEWLDFNMIQSHGVPQFIERLVPGDWELDPPKPTINSEAWYEDEEQLYERWTGMRNSDGTMPDAGWVQRFQAYWSVFLGGFGFTYGHGRLWRMQDYDNKPGVLLESALDAPGPRDLLYLRTLIESAPLQTYVPDQSLVTPNTRGVVTGLSPDLRCATRAADGSWAYVYSTRGSLIRFVMRKLARGTADAFWYNPRTGTWRSDRGRSTEKIPFERSIPSGGDAADRYFDPPDNPRNGNDWVLVLEVRERS